MKKGLFLLTSICMAFHLQVAAVQAEGEFDYSLVEGRAVITSYTGSATEVTIPETIDGYTVSGVGEEAFKDNTTIQKVVMPDSIVKVYKDAFYDCSNLVEVKFSDSLKTLQGGAFRNCDSLTSIVLPATLEKAETYYGSIGYDYDSNGLIYKHISPFYDCDNLKTVVFQEGMTQIPNNMLCLVSSVENVTMPDTIIRIGSSAFCKCNNIKTINLSSNLQEIGNMAFKDCTRLKGIVIPDMVTAIGTDAFYNCSSMEVVVLSASLKALDAGAFRNCDGVTAIETPNTLETVGTYYEDGIQVSSFFDCNNLKTVSFQDGMSKIPANMFYLVYSVENVTMPATITNIGDKAFTRCNQIKAITLSENLLEIGEEAFYGCEGLTEIEIPEMVTTIGEDAFRNCSKLANVTLSDCLKTLGGGAFRNCDALTTIEIPASMKTAECGWEYPTPGNVSPFYDCNQLKTVTFAEGLTAIPARMFYYVQSIESVTMPDTVTSIGAAAFGSCNKLSEIKVSTNLTTIGEDAFNGCAKLTSFAMPDSVTEIGNEAFYGCTIMTTTMPASLVGVGESAFYNCDALTEVNIGNKATFIDDNAFNDCGALKKVTLGNALKRIYSGAFANCPKITSVVIPDSVETINDKAFASCINLTEVTIYKTKNFGKDIFSFPSKMTIYGIAGEKAETYANEIGADFVNIDYFSDVIASSNNWQYAPARYMFEKTYMTGKGTDANGKASFYPNANLSRAEFAQIIYSIEKKPEITYSVRFSDVPEGQWFTSAVLWVADQGIVSGYGEKYGSNDNITREQLAAILYKYAGAKGYDTSARADISKFNDCTEISDYAVEAIKWANANGIISGKGENIDPKGNATRAECAAMVRRFDETFGE